MRKILLLSLGILWSATFLFAQESEKAHEMSGTICNSKCVVQQTNTPTCDVTCTDKSGDVVFVQDDGKVMKIENPKMAMPHMGKHVKMMAQETEKQREELLRIMQLTEQGP
jgi:hypothetical protein